MKFFPLSYCSLALSPDLKISSYPQTPVSPRCLFIFKSCCSVTQLCLTLCNPVYCSMPGFPVPHHLPKFAQIHIFCISDAIQPSHPLSSPSPLPSIFPSVRVFSNESAVHISDQNTEVSAVASVFPMSIQGWFTLRFTDLISLLSKGLSVVFFSTTVQRHQFIDALPYLRSSYPNHMWPLGRP